MSEFNAVAVSFDSVPDSFGKAGLTAVLGGTAPVLDGVGGGFAGGDGFAGAGGFAGGWCGTASHRLGSALPGAHLLVFTRGLVGLVVVVVTVVVWTVTVWTVVVWTIVVWKVDVCAPARAGSTPETEPSATAANAARAAQALRMEVLTTRFGGPRDCLR